jgi:hypothetical protein
MEAGCTQEEVRRAVEVAQGVKQTPARLMVNLAARLMDLTLVEPGPGGSGDSLAARTAGAPRRSCCSSASTDEEHKDESSDGHD